MLTDYQVEIQAEQFLGFHKKQNTIENTEVRFALWSESKDFNEEDLKRIKEIILNKGSKNGT